MQNDGSVRVLYGIIKFIDGVSLEKSKTKPLTRRRMSMGTLRKGGLL